MSFEQVYLGDGAGNGNTAGVNSKHQLLTRAIAVSSIHEASLLGDAYSWSAVSANIDTTDCMLLVANTSQTRKLVIDHCYVRGDIAGNINLKVCSVAGLTLAGTAVVGTNLNTGSANIAPASAWADETASPATTIVQVVYQHLCVNAQGTTSPMIRVDFDGAIVLAYNTAFGIDTILEPAAGFEASVYGYYID